MDRQGTHTRLPWRDYPGEALAEHVPLIHQFRRAIKSRRPRS